MTTDNKSAPQSLQGEKVKTALGKRREKRIVNKTRSNSADYHDNEPNT